MSIYVFVEDMIDIIENIDVSNLYTYVHICLLLPKVTFPNISYGISTNNYSRLFVIIASHLKYIFEMVSWHIIHKIIIIGCLFNTR